VDDTKSFNTKKFFRLLLGNHLRRPTKARLNGIGEWGPSFFPVFAYFPERTFSQKGRNNADVKYAN
jgi:hypothetical protein